MNLADLTEVVRPFALGIQNGRTLDDVLRHMQGEGAEVQEAIDEGDYQHALKEFVDVIACALDGIVLINPKITGEEVGQILQTACERWARRYKDSVDGDRTIE